MYVNMEISWLLFKGLFKIFIDLLEISVFY